MFGASAVARATAARRGELAALLGVVGWACLSALLRALRRLHDSVRDERFRVGMRLQNFQEEHAQPAAIAAGGEQNPQ